jgi:hypothetical protein
VQGIHKRHPVLVDGVIDGRCRYRSLACISTVEGVWVGGRIVGLTLCTEKRWKSLQAVHVGDVECPALTLYRRQM